MLSLPKNMKICMIKLMRDKMDIPCPIWWKWFPSWANSAKVVDMYETCRFIMLEQYGNENWSPITYSVHSPLPPRLFSRYRKPVKDWVKKIDKDLLDITFEQEML